MLTIEKIGGFFRSFLVGLGLSIFAGVFHLNVGHQGLVKSLIIKMVETTKD